MRIYFSLVFYLNVHVDYNTVTYGSQPKKKIFAVSSFPDKSVANSATQNRFASEGRSEQWI